MRAVSDYEMIAHYAVGAAALAVNCTSETEPQRVIAMDARSAAYWAWKARDEAAFLEREGAAP